MDYIVGEKGQLEFIFYRDATEEFLSYYIKPRQETIPVRFNSCLGPLLTPQELGGVIIEEDTRRYGACA